MNRFALPGTLDISVQGIDGEQALYGEPFNDPHVCRNSRHYTQVHSQMVYMDRFVFSLKLLLDIAVSATLARRETGESFDVPWMNYDEDQRVYIISDNACKRLLYGTLEFPTKLMDFARRRGPVFVEFEVEDIRYGSFISKLKVVMVGSITVVGINLVAVTIAENVDKVHVYIGKNEVHHCSIENRLQAPDPVQLLSWAKEYRGKLDDGGLLVLQKYLLQLGYYNGIPDDLIGPLTRQAVADSYRELLGKKLSPERIDEKHYMAAEYLAAVAWALAETQVDRKEK